jgi:glycosyltransferase involved in cell wall biosynthesis
VSRVSEARPKRVAVVAPSNRRIGGQALHASTLVQYLCREGYEAEFLPIDPERPGWLAWSERVPFLRTLINQALYWPSLLRLRRADVVQASSASYWSFLLAPVPAMLMGRLFGKPVILNYHSGEAADHLAHWGWLVHPWLALADEIVVPSAYLQSVFASHGYRTRVIHNTVDTARFTYRTRDPFRPRLLSIRTFEWYYGVDDTLRAFALVKRACPEATLDVAGTGSQEGRLRELAASLKVDGIRFLGPVPAEGMPEHPAQCVIGGQPTAVHSGGDGVRLGHRYDRNRGHRQYGRASRDGDDRAGAGSWGDGRCGPGVASRTGPRTRHGQARPWTAAPIRMEHGRLPVGRLVRGDPARDGQTGRRG